MCWQVSTSRLISFKCNYAYVRIGRLRGKADCELTFGLLECERLSIRKHSGGNHFASEIRQRNGMPVPVKHEHVDRFVLRGCAISLHSLDRSVGGSVNGVAVQRQPISDGAQTLLKLRLNLPCWFGSDIEQKISAAARNLDEALNQFAGGFEIPVVLVVCPGIVDGHA